MKRLIIIFAFMIVGIFEFGNAYAVDVSTMCNGVAPTQGFNKFLAIKNKLATYPSALSPQEDGTYVLCFSDAVPINGNSELQIIGHEDKPLIIYGLNVSTSNADSSALLNISGSNVTLQSSILSGPVDGNGTGAAIQVNGTNITIKNSTISNFAEGIRVANDASVKLENNIFETIGSDTTSHS